MEPIDPIMLLVSLALCVLYVIVCKVADRREARRAAAIYLAARNASESQGSGS